MSAARLLPFFLLLPCGAARAEPAEKAAAAAVKPAKNVAGSVVRSKEWIVRRGKARQEEFVGDVRYEAAGTKLTSDWALYRQGQNDWHARGNVYARREFEAGDAVETRGENAWYDENTLKGRLEPAPGVRVPVLHTPLQGGPDHADGDHLSWIGQNVGILSGRTHGWGPRGEFWAEEARYDRLLPADRSLTLTGNRPALHQFHGGDDVAVKGDRIVAYDLPRRAVVTGRARGWIIAQSTAAPKTGPSALLCGQGSRSEGPGPDERVTALLSPLEAARSPEEERRFWEAETAAYSALACPWGPHSEFWAEEARDDRATADRSLTLSGNRPVLHSSRGGDEVAVKGDRIVAYDSPRRAVVTGRALGWVIAQSTEAPKAGPAALLCAPGSRSAGPGPDARVTSLLFPAEAGGPAEEERRFWEAETAAFVDRACPWGPRVDFWADEADYAQEPVRVMTLSGGRPVLHKIDDDENSAIKADKIVAFAETRRIVAAGKVRGWIVFKEEKKKEKKKPAEKTK